MYPFHTLTFCSGSYSACNPHVLHKQCKGLLPFPRTIGYFKELGIDTTSIRLEDDYSLAWATAKTSMGCWCHSKSLQSKQFIDEISLWKLKQTLLFQIKSRYLTRWSLFVSKVVCSASAGFRNLIFQVTSHNALTMSEGLNVDGLVY